MASNSSAIKSGLPPFSPRRTQQLPGGSKILDQNLDLIKKHLDGMTDTVNTVIRTFNIRTSGPPDNGGGGGSTMAGGFPLTSGGFTSSRHDSSGAEFLSYAWSVPFSQMTGSLLTVILCFYAASASGLATFRLRVGGTYHTVTGTVPASGTTVAATSGMVKKRIVATFANPGTDGDIKLTQQSSANGVDCAVDQANGIVF